MIWPGGGDRAIAYARTLKGDVSVPTATVGARGLGPVKAFCDQHRPGRHRVRFHYAEPDHERWTPQIVVLMIWPEP